MFLFLCFFLAIRRAAVSRKVRVLRPQPLSLRHGERLAVALPNGLCNDSAAPKHPAARVTDRNPRAKMNILQMIGESVSRAVQDAKTSMDGSYIGVQTQKGFYMAGEVVNGFVVLQNNSVRQVDRVLLKITIKERTYWDEEVARQMSEGEGDQRKTWTVYEH